MKLSASIFVSSQETINRDPQVSRPVHVFWLTSTIIVIQPEPPVSAVTVVSGSGHRLCDGPPCTMKRARRARDTDHTQWCELVQTFLHCPRHSLLCLSSILPTLSSRCGELMESAATSMGWRAFVSPPQKKKRKEKEEVAGGLDYCPLQTLGWCILYGGMIVCARSEHDKITLLISIAAVGLGCCPQHTIL